MALLTAEDIEARLVDLAGWELDDDEIQKTFALGSFAASMVFANEVAWLAESVNHHPEIGIKYDRVKIELSTHSEGGVTEKDLALAAQIEALAGRGAGEGTAGP